MVVVPGAYKRCMKPEFHGSAAHKLLVVP